MPVLQVRLRRRGAGFQSLHSGPRRQQPPDRWGMHKTTARMHASTLPCRQGRRLAWLPASRPPPAAALAPPPDACRLAPAPTERSTYCWDGLVFRCANSDYACIGREGPCQALKREPKLTGAAGARAVRARDAACSAAPCARANCCPPPLPALRAPSSQVFILITRAPTTRECAGGVGHRYRGRRLHMGRADAPYPPAPPLPTRRHFAWGGLSKLCAPGGCSFGSACRARHGGGVGGPTACLLPAVAWTPPAHASLRCPATPPHQAPGATACAAAAPAPRSAPRAPAGATAATCAALPTAAASAR